MISVKGLCVTRFDAIVTKLKPAPQGLTSQWGQFRSVGRFEFQNVKSKGDEANRERKRGRNSRWMSKMGSRGTELFSTERPTNGEPEASASLSIQAYTTRQTGFEAPALVQDPNVAHTIQRWNYIAPSIKCWRWIPKAVKRKLLVRATPRPDISRIVNPCLHHRVPQLSHVCNFILFRYNVNRLFPTAANKHNCSVKCWAKYFIAS